MQRVWRAVESVREHGGGDPAATDPTAEPAPLRKAAHRAIRDVTDDIANFRFNKAIARLYELTGQIASA